MVKATLRKAVHEIPKDVKDFIEGHKKILGFWQDITPLARNEWICWIISAKKDETRTRRMRIMKENLLKGKKRPCCWAGCSHR